MNNYKDYNSIFSDIYKLVGVKNQSDLAALLEVRQSALSDCKRRGRLSTKIYLSLAEHGYDVSEILQRQENIKMKEALKELLQVESSKEIAEILEVPEETVAKSMEGDEKLPREILRALLQKGFDIRKIAPEKGIEWVGVCLKRLLQGEPRKDSADLVRLEQAILLRLLRKGEVSSETILAYAQADLDLRRWEHRLPRLS